MECIAFEVLLLFFLFSDWILRRNSRLLNLLLLLVGASSVMLILYQYLVGELPVSNPVSSILYPEIAIDNIEEWPFSRKYEYLFVKSMNSNIILLIGIFNILSSISRNKENTLIPAMFLFSLLLYFFPEVYTYRLYKEISLFESIVLAIGLSEISSHFRKVQPDKCNNQWANLTLKS